MIKIQTDKLRGMVMEREIIIGSYRYYFNRGDGLRVFEKVK